MSEVECMLEGDGLVEKWTASHNHINPNTNFFLANKDSKIQSHPSMVPRHDDYDHDCSSMFGMMMIERNIERVIERATMLCNSMFFRNQMGAPLYRSCTKQHYDQME
ncbi:hypothetical protein ACSBR2_022065 [Camellia fascicularis]